MFFTEAGLWAAGKALEHGADSLFEDRGKIKGFLSSAWKRIFRGKIVVVVNGLGGAGKSKLQQVLSGEKSIGELDPIYRLSIDNEPTHVKGDYFTTILTRPGQPTHFQFYDDQIKAALISAERIIVINVVTFGYNALYNNVPLDLVPGYDPRNTLEETASAYLDLQRLAELDRLRDFCTMLRSLPAAKKIDILTVANKLDLWWNHRNLVERHYSQSGYATIIDDLIESKGPSFARHTLTSVSLILSNIRTADEKVLAHPTPGFDAVLQDRNFRMFAEVASSFLKA